MNKRRSKPVKAAAHPRRGRSMWIRVAAVLIASAAIFTFTTKRSQPSSALASPSDQFLPTVENQKGWMIGGWNPHFNLSGPLLKNRAWFSDSFDSVARSR